MSRPSLRELVAIHEAGHAVAAQLRSGCALTRPVVLTDDADMGCGITQVRTVVGPDTAFVHWAGPWAEARLGLWPTGLAVDEEDSDGHRFEDHLAAVLLSQTGDRASIEAAVAASWVPMTDDDVVRAEGIWHRELERQLQVIRRTADRLLAGEAVSDTGVWQTVRGLTQTGGRSLTDLPPVHPHRGGEPS